MKEFGAEEVNESGPKDKISRAANRKIRDRNQLWEDDYFSWGLLLPFIFHPVRKMRSHNDYFQKYKFIRIWDL